MKDHRSAPFCFQEHSAIELIHQRWSGRERATALAIYQAMTYKASIRHRAGGRGGFPATRAELAEAAGSKASTVGTYADAFVELGILEVEHRTDEVGRDLPPLWALTTPGDSRGTEEDPYPHSRDTEEHPKGSASAPEKDPSMRGRGEVEEERRTSRANALDVSPDQEHLRLAQLLADLISGNGSKPPTAPQIRAWADQVRLMVERDGRTLELIEGCIRWTQAHEFWKANVLSMGKLRDKFDQLRLQAERERRPRNRSERQAQTLAALDVMAQGGSA